MSQWTTIAAAQIEPILFEKERNLAKIEEYAGRAAKQRAELVVFPEAALTGYCFASLEEAMPFAEPVPGPSTVALAGLCRELRLHVVVGMLEQADGMLYNAAVLIGPGGVLACYRKTHLPYLGVDRFAAPGQGPLAVHRTPVGAIGLHICYDATFPEVARSMALQGAEVLALPTNWPQGRENMPRYVVHARALENRVHFVACDRVGEERGFRFIGRSKIVSATGDALAEAGPDEEELILAEVDLDAARNKRIVYRPGEFEVDLFGDRRPELYRAVAEEPLPSERLAASADASPFRAGRGREAG